MAKEKGHRKGLGGGTRSKHLLKPYTENKKEEGREKENGQRNKSNTRRPSGSSAKGRQPRSPRIGNFRQEDCENWAEV